MTKLPTDVSRCLGQMDDFGHGACPRRLTCARYLAGFDDATYGHPTHVPHAYHLCRPGEDFRIPADDEDTAKAVSATEKAIRQGLGGGA